jgi:iron complex outermembrane receptor protein
MKNIFMTTLPVALAALTSLAVETNEIPVITVTASAQTAETAAIHDVLRAEPGVVLNSQGGSQNDLSVRGSSFSGAGLALGGLTLRNPQTEHFHAELPLPATMLSRPSVFTGLANQGGHLVGTVGFDLLPIIGNKQFEFGFGSDSRDWQSLLVQHMLSDTLGLGVFAGRESANGVDHPDNDYDREYFGGHLQHKKNDTQVDLIIAHQKKEFGARGYYGVSDTLPAEEKTDDTLVFLSVARGRLNADYLRGGLSWREFNDDYTLPTISYRNQHRSRISSAFVDGRTIEINGWALGWRGDVEEERIASSGTEGLGFHHRTRGGISLLPQWRGDRLTITAGARGEFFTKESAEFLPQLGADYALSDNLSAFASYSESVRLPSYTELYYSSPASAGDPTLQPQTAAQAELGMKGIPSEFLNWKASVFHRRTLNTIDWTRQTAAARWTAGDLGTLETVGLEARLGWYPAQNIDVQFAYSWLYKNKDANDFGAYASRYALDYPEHLAQASLLWRPVDAIELGTVQTLRLQTENHARSGSDFGADSSFVVRYTPQQLDYATLALLINNVWDSDFQTFPGQRPPQRYAGISLTLNW